MVVRQWIQVLFCNHINGKLHGKAYSWDDRGYLVSEIEFDQGKTLRPSTDTFSEACSSSTITNFNSIKALSKRKGNKFEPARLNSNPAIEIIVNNKDHVFNISLSVNPTEVFAQPKNHRHSSTKE